MHDLAAHLANLMTGYATGNGAPILQQALQRVYSDGQIQSQVSTALQLPLATVKTGIRDGLRRLAAVSGGGAS